ncbi:MAG: ABC transporter permease [Clostridiales bacterium]|nr:ABC transporter permease [Bacillota bacterium]NLL55370.1 ABC transporter permease [Clostridiales bacterium]
MNTKKKSFNWAELFSRFGVVAIFALALLAASIASDRFFTVVNLLSVFVQCSIVGVLACGMTMLIVSGNTDLSAGSGVALGGVVCGVIMKANGNWLLAVLATFAVLLFTCYLQSLLVAYVGLMPFIVTLAGQLALRGAAYVVSKGAPIIGIGSIANLSSQKFLGVFSWLIVLTVIMVALSWSLMNYTSFGRYIYATGGNRAAAIAAGINTKRVIVYAYLFMGVCTALAAIMLAARTNSGQPTAGQAYEFDAIIAAVLGGTSMSGGVGSVVGSLIGALTVGTINNCMNLVGISPYYQQIVKGIIIIIAIVIDKKTRDAVMQAD